MIEKCLRQIYGGYIEDDSEITFPLVNTWLSEAIGVAAKQCYKESVQIDAVGYVNNSFYTTFKGLSPVQDELFLWKITLPQIPIGIGKNEGVASLKFKSSDNVVGIDCVPLSINERGFYKSQRRIPNKVLYYDEGIFLYVITTIALNTYTATVTMISGGDSTDLNSILNIPDDYYPVITEYIKGQLGFERAQPKDQADDGTDTK
jgi:hypothetical protein